MKSCCMLGHTDSYNVSRENIQICGVFHMKNKLLGAFNKFVCSYGQRYMTKNDGCMDEQMQGQTDAGMHR